MNTILSAMNRTAYVVSIAAALGVGAFAALPASGAFQVKYVEGSNPEWIAELDAHGIREEMEAWGPEICRAYTGGSTEAVDNRVVTFQPTSGSGVAWTSGSYIAINMDWYYEVTPNEARGALVHEMGHAIQGCVGDWLGRTIDLGETIELSNGTTEHLTEGLAEYVRRYCFASAREVQDREYDLAKKGYDFSNYGDGAGLIAYICRAYGQNALRDLLYWCSTNSGYKVDRLWPAITGGRTFAQVLDDWKHEDRISDPVVQWTFDGTADGIQRLYWGKCSFNFTSRAGSLSESIEDGDWTVALRAKADPQSAGDAVFSLGSAFSIQASKPETYHTIVAVKSGTTVTVYLDGAANRIGTSTVDADLPANFTLCAGFECQDLRMFARALNATELAQYFAAFPADYAPLAAATARWTGPGNGALSDAANWYCVNANGDEVAAVPSASTDVIAWGATVPNVPAGATLPCRSFTVKRWITLDRDADWRGLSVPVGIGADAAIRTSGHTLTAGSVTGATVRLYGHLAYGSLSLTGDLILCGGSVLEMPAFNDNTKTQIGGKLLLQDNTPALIKPASGELAAGTYTILTTTGGVPSDLSMLRMTGISGRKTCTFSRSGNGKTLKATVANADFCLWTGAAGDGRFSTSGNWADGVKPTVGGGEKIVFAAASAGTITNDIGNLSPASIEFAPECTAITVAGSKFTLPSGAAITRLSTATPVFTAPVQFANEIHTVGDVRFEGGVTAPDIHADQGSLLGHYTLTYSGEWTPQGLYYVQSGSSLSVDQFTSTYEKDDSPYGLAIALGGAVTTRVAKVAAERDLVMSNAGTFTVTEKFSNTSMGRLAYDSPSTGRFFFKSVETASLLNFEFNPSDVNWKNVDAITNSEDVIMGSGGINFPSSSSGGEISLWYDRGIAFGCTEDWTLGERKKNRTVYESLCASGEGAFYFGTADYFDPSAKHTVTIKGMIKGSDVFVAAYGGGTLKFSCTESGQFGRGLAVLDATTLEYASTSAKAGGGDVLLAPGATLALPSAGSGAVTVTGNFAPTNGAGTVYVRLGSAGTTVTSGTYNLVTAGSAMSSDFVSRLSLANPTRVGATVAFGLANSSKTLTLTVADTSAAWSGGGAVTVPDGGITVTTFTVSGASSENPVAVTMGDGGALAAGSYQVLTATALPDADPNEYLALANEIPGWHAATFRKDGSSIYLDVALDSERLGWINEKADTTLLTGEWSDDVSYGLDGRAYLMGENVFTPFAATPGRTVVVEFKSVLYEDSSETFDDATAQAAIRLGTNGCFQVWTGGNVANVEMLPMANANVANDRDASQLGTGNVGNTGNIPRWLDVSAEGVTPVDGGEYVFRVRFNYASGKYSASVVVDGREHRLYAADGKRWIPFAASGSSLSSVVFDGETYFTSLFGKRWKTGIQIMVR